MCKREAANIINRIGNTEAAAVLQLAVLLGPANFLDNGGGDRSSRKQSSNLHIIQSLSFFVKGG